MGYIMIEDREYLKLDDVSLMTSAIKMVSLQRSGVTIEVLVDCKFCSF